MLPRAHRLTSSADFRRATRQGRRAAAHTLVVHLWVGEGSSQAKVGFVVSKAVGNAVVRNRVKRQLRHLAREQLSALPGSAVLVVRARPAAAGASSGRLEKDLRRCLERVEAA